MRPQPAMHEQELTPGDRVLLCNQTVARTLGDEHIASLLESDADGRQIVRWMTRRATLRGQGENTVGILIDIAPSGGF